MRHGAIPWRYFQLNGNYFNKQKGIFSKLDLDANFPKHMRLKQYYYNADETPKSYPVFIKPEWGQNSNGILCVYNDMEYRGVNTLAKKNNMPFIVQQAASGIKEYEIYYLRSSDNKDEYSFLSITQVINKGRESYPINSIHNPDTSYFERTSGFSADEMQVIWRTLKTIGNFRMARVGVKANDITNLLSGEFHIVEINLFLPMPLVLLAENVNIEEKHKIVKTTMSLASELVKSIPKKETGKWIFFRKMIAHYKTTQ